MVKQRIPLILIFLLGLFLYTVKLTSLPSGFHGDEGETALQATKILKGGAGLIGVGWYDLPLASFWPQVVTFSLFGPTIFAARLPSAIFGVLTLFSFYFLVKIFYPKTVAFLATLLLAISHWWIALSRLTPSYTQAVFLEMTAFYFAFSGLKNGRPFYFLLAGAFTGLTFYSYFPARITPLILIPFFLIFLFQERQKIKGAILLFSFCAAGLLLVFAPQGLFFLKHPQTFSSRTKAVFLFAPDGREWTKNEYQGKGLVRILFEQTKKTFSLFGQDKGGQYGYKGMILDPPTLIFFLSGMIFILFSWQKISSLLFLLWFSLTLLLGGILTTIPEPPFAPRLAGVFPVISLLTALGISFWAKFLSRKVAFIFTTGVLLLIAFLNLKTYFWESEKNQWGDPNKYTATKIASYLNSYPSAEAIFLTAPFLYSDFGSIRFLAPKAKTQNIAKPLTFIPPSISRETLFIVYPIYKNKISDIIRTNPQGELIEEKNPQRQTQFFLYKVSP